MPLFENMFLKTNATFDIMAPMKPEIIQVKKITKLSPNAKRQKPSKLQFSHDDKKSYINSLSITRTYEHSNYVIYV